MKNTQIIALYLPQFHRIPENDAWWGEGFTEWTNVKKAKPLYEGHIQPRIPLNNDYYDLSDCVTMIRQMRLAKSYGIDGFCFYHYWFNGKKLLEKPVENILVEKSIPLPFMFCWANEPWTRTWDGSRGAKEILIDQYYGGKEEWRSHFDYLKTFFERDEYIKIDNKPVICIYKSKDIANREEMLSYWSSLARRIGFNGIYIINTLRFGGVEELPLYGDGVFDFEPFYTMSNLGGKLDEIYIIKESSFNPQKQYRVYDYRKLCRVMTGRLTLKSVNHFLGFFCGWDNSPRVGQNAEWMFSNNSPENFEEFFSIQYRKSNELHNDFLFINAWNEWAEGTFLEPDEQNGYEYLKAIKKVKEC